MTICCNRALSVLALRMSWATSWHSSTPSWMRGLTVSHDDVTRSPTSNRSGFTSIRPASIFDRSSRSLIIPRRWSDACPISAVEQASLNANYHDHGPPEDEGFSPYVRGVTHRKPCEHSRTEACSCDDSPDAEPKMSGRTKSAADLAQDERSSQLLARLRPSPAPPLTANGYRTAETHLPTRQRGRVRFLWPVRRMVYCQRTRDVIRGRLSRIAASALETLDSLLGTTRQSRPIGTRYPAELPHCTAGPPRDLAHVRNTRLFVLSARPKLDGRDYLV